MGLGQNNLLFAKKSKLSSLVMLAIFRCACVDMFLSSIILYQSDRNRYYPIFVM
jgi:hypothetical protein